MTQGARVTLARRLLSYLSAEAEPSLRFLLLVKLVSKEKDNLRNRKSPLSLILTALATLMVMASVILTASSAQAARGHNNKVVKTTINIRTSTKIGNTTLAPGKYRREDHARVRRIRRPDGSVFDPSQPLWQRLQPTLRRSSCSHGAGINDGSACSDRGH